MTRRRRRLEKRLYTAPFSRAEFFAPRPRDLLAAYRAAIDVMRWRVRAPRLEDAS
jgi:hypothetical protein